MDIYNLKIIFHFLLLSTIFYFLNSSLFSRHPQSIQYFTNDFATLAHHEKDQRPGPCKRSRNAEQRGKTRKTSRILHPHTPSPTTTSTNLLIRSPVEKFRLTRALPFPKISSNLSSLLCNPLYSASNDISLFLFATILHTNYIYTQRQA